jgi:hypothetical protein
MCPRHATSGERVPEALVSGPELRFELFGEHHVVAIIGLALSEPVRPTESAAVERRRGIDQLELESLELMREPPPTETE